jgi:predicted membrane protein (TIGR00267 family)
VRRAVELARLPLILGLTDGLLNALTLSAAALLRSGGSVTYGLAVRIACVGLITASFSVFVSDYAERRAALVRGSRQLNLTAHGHLATTRLGQLALRRSLAAMAIACSASFAGSLLPLAAGAAWPEHSWIVVALCIVCLAGLGFLLGQALAHHAWRWAGLMGCGGLAVTLLGFWLRIT